MTTGVMADTLAQLAELTALVYSKEAHWQVEEMTLLRPADEGAIRKLEQECPHPLPPSYQQFLRQHDGCLNFWAQFALLGTQGEPYRIVREQVDDAREFQKQFVADEQGRITPESVARFEAVTDLGQQFYLPNHVVFGTNQGGEFFLFNETQQAAAGEYEVIHYTYDAGAYLRYASFPSFLTAKVEELRQRIKKKKYR